MPSTVRPAQALRIPLQTMARTRRPQPSPTTVPTPQIAAAKATVGADQPLITAPNARRCAHAARPAACHRRARRTITNRCCFPVADSGRPAAGLARCHPIGGARAQPTATPPTRRRPQPLPRPVSRPNANRRRPMPEWPRIPPTTQSRLRGGEPPPTNDAASAARSWRTPDAAPRGQQALQREQQHGGQGEPRTHGFRRHRMRRCAT